MDSEAKKSQADIIADAARKAVRIVKGEQRSIYHLAHLEETPLPIGFEEEPRISSSFTVTDDCCGVLFAGDPQPSRSSRASISEPYEDSSY